MSRDDQGDQLDLSEESFESLLERARSGSEEALAHLVDRFSPSVYRSIRRSLMRSLRRNTDSDDIAQSVWRSFFANRDKHLLMESPDQMKGFLARMAAHKAIDRGRQYIAQQKNAEVRLAGEGGEEVLSVSAKKRVPSPSEELIARESLETLANSVPQKFSEVFRKRAEGASISEISEELGVPLRSLHRILQHVRIRKS